jgi:hypothetical protein
MILGAGCQGIREKAETTIDELRGIKHDIYRHDSQKNSIRAAWRAWLTRSGIVPAVGLLTRSG